MRLLISIALIPLLHAQLPQPPAAHVVTISPSTIRANEPSIAVNPNNPNQVIAVFQPAGAAWSTDGAQTFSLADLPAIPTWRTGGDVSTTFDTKGHAYLCSLHFDKLGSASYWAHNAGRNGIFVRRSLDAGKTWEKTAATVKAFPNDTDPNIQWEDMPRLFSDTSPKSPHAGTLYVGWIEWQLDQSIILFARSTDEGKTFSTPIRISTHPGLPRDDNGALVGFVGAVASDGTIYAIWNDASTITYTESHDGGKSFSPSRPIMEVAPPYFGGAGGVPGVARVMGFPQIAVDSNSNLYVCWSDYRNGDVDVFLSKSTDHAHTWSAPIRVNTDPQHNGKDQFFQWMTVDPITSAIYVQFYDRRDDPANRKTKITLARSVDGGHTFTNYAWTTTPFEGQQLFLGDYTWLTAYNNHVYGVWTESAEGQPIESDPRKQGRPFTVVRVGTADFSRR